jgi:hypothetical protein
MSRLSLLRVTIAVCGHSCSRIETACVQHGVLEVLLSLLLLLVVLLLLVLLL